MSQIITRVAVVGAGTMGAAIAGLVASAGVPVVLLDTPPNELSAEEQAKGLTLEHPAVRNRLVQGGFERMRKARPANLMRERDAQLITLGNTEDNFDLLAEADWIIEVIVEQLGSKRALMERIEAVRKPGSVVSTNTSGIPVHQIAEGRSLDFRAHFLGTHFFNPPRYLKLLEVIPTADTAPEVLDTISHFGSRVLGKGVVLCKDTPNFIANRLGTFSALSDLRFIQDHGYSIEEVDALTGPLIGRPNTATFRLLDLAGNDIMAYVAKNLYQAVPDDESREVFSDTALLERMVADKRLGTKAGQGFYKESRVGGVREFQPLDLQTFEYRSPQKPAFGIIEETKRLRSLPERLRFIIKRATEQPDDRGAQLVAQTTLPVLAYAARRLPEIANSIADIDHAMVWGFNQALGPFATWDALGVPETAELMRSRGITVAGWVEQMIAGGNTSFYKQGDGVAMAFSPVSGSYEPLPVDEREISIQALKAAGAEVRGNKSASLVDLGEGVLCFEFHSKANTLDQDTISLGLEALEELKNPRWVGMVVGNDGDHFSLGANLVGLGQAAAAGQWDAVEQIVRGLQGLVQGLRYCPKPVVSAPAGRALGGGAEVLMHSARTVAAAESYIGLVEFGVGLIPAGGGCKELLRRLVSPEAHSSAAVLQAQEQVFTLITQAKVSASAAEAQELGYLRPTDRIVFNRAHLLWEARHAVLDLVAEGYRPPQPGKHCYALGRDGLAALKIGIHMMKEAGYATPYDAEIATRLASVLTGGELSSAQWVEEQYILDRECEVFMSLCKEPKTLERAQYMLENGKPLRN